MSRRGCSGQPPLHLLGVAAPRLCGRPRSDALVDIGRRRRRRCRSSPRPSSDRQRRQWIDGAIGGSGDTARADHHQPHHRRRSARRDAVQPRPRRRRTDRGRPDAGPRPTLATKDKWDEIVRPKSQLEGCTGGRQGLLRAGQHPFGAVDCGLIASVFEDAGLPVPKNWDEFVAAAPKLKEKGIMPLAIGARRAGRSTCCFDQCICVPCARQATSA